MSKKIVHGTCEHTIWRVIDNNWRCIYRKYTDGFNEVVMQEYCNTLATYLWMHNFDINDTIVYCLARNSEYTLKFRHAGGQIDCYIESV